MTTNGDRPTPPHGIAPTVRVLAAKTTQHDSDITELRGSVARVEGMVGGLMGEVGGLSRQVEGLSVDVRHALRIASSPPPPPPLPAMRAELPSTMDPRELKTELRKAARDGERDPNSTAEARVEAVLERVELIRRGRLFNKILWLAITGAAGLAFDRIIIALGHH